MIAIMVSVTIFVGALAQFPAGRLSDRIDRRYVLAGLAGLGAVAGLAVAAVQPHHVGVRRGSLDRLSRSLRSVRLVLPRCR
ncbi:hypothetical protein KFZ73_27755, partial [Tsukamurella paurometabola]|nr:hypothetical protein [Tsukamurella paurometabola]